jgi:hypothetical protein
MDMRIGINLGDVIAEKGDVFGDGVNVAARLEQLSRPGGLAISSGVREQIAGRVDHQFDDTGFHTLKNIDRPVHVYQSHVAGAEDEAGPARGMFDFGADLGGQPVVTGGCLCGAIRFESTQQPLGSGYCHCRICQKFTGAPVGVWTAFTESAVRFTSGAPKTFMSSPIAERGFCAECGTSMTYRLVKPQACGYVVIFNACLDHPERFAPSSHGGVESQMPWLDINDGLPRTRCDQSWALRNAWASVGRENPESWGPGD